MNNLKDHLTMALDRGQWERARMITTLIKEVKEKSVPFGRRFEDDDCPLGGDISNDCEGCVELLTIIWKYLSLR